MRTQKRIYIKWKINGEMEMIEINNIYELEESDWDALLEDIWKELKE